MPLIRPIEMNAPRHAASASASSERCWPGRRTGCRINDDPWRRRAKLASAAPSSNASYQQLQPPSPINHKKITQLRQKLADFSAGVSECTRGAGSLPIERNQMGPLAVINQMEGAALGSSRWIRATNSFPRNSTDIRPSAGGWRGSHALRAATPATTPFKGLATAWRAFGPNTSRLQAIRGWSPVRCVASAWRQ